MSERKKEGREWSKERKRGRKNGNPILHYFLACLPSSPFSPSIEVNWSSRTSESLWQLTVLIRCTCVSAFLFSSFPHFRFSAPFFWTLITFSYLHLVVYWWSFLFASPFRMCVFGRKEVCVKGKRKWKKWFFQRKRGKIWEENDDELTEIPNSYSMIERLENFLIETTERNFSNFQDSLKGKWFITSNEMKWIIITLLFHVTF